LPELVDTPSALAAALPRLASAPSLALDTETDAFFAYRPRICLLQVSVPGHDYLIDPLAGIDLSGLGALLAEPGRRTVLHAAENDVILMQHEYGWRVGHLFDTQVACFVLGLKPYSLAGILEARFGVRLDKGQQRSDWSRRPLTPKQIAYAAEDTCHLLDLARDLEDRAVATGRLEEIEHECRRIAAREWEPEPFDPEAFRRFPGAGELRPEALRLLRDLYLLRHREAERRNRAPYRIVSDGALVALARKPGPEPPRGVPPSFWQRYGNKVRGLAERARGQGPLPPPPRRKRAEGERATAETKRRFEKLRRWRAAEAEARGVEAFVVARNDLLMKIAAADCKTLDDLAALVEPFRLREYGEAMLRAMLDSGQ